MAEKFAAKVIDATEVIQSDYYKEENQGELAAQGIRKLYKFVEEKVPDAIEARLQKVKDLNEDQLKELLIDARTAPGQARGPGQGQGHRRGPGRDAADA